MAELAGANVVRIAEEVLARDLFDPLWPGLTESDWEQDAKLVARAYLWAEAERSRLREAIASALTSLATGPLRDGYAYAVLSDALGPEAMADDLCAHGCGDDATVQHADGRFLCYPCYRVETGGDNGPPADCPTCGPEEVERG